MIVICIFFLADGNVNITESLAVAVAVARGWHAGTQYGFIYFRASALETASNMRAQKSDSLQNVPAHASQIGWHFYVEPRADQLGNCKEQSERRHYKK